MSEYARRPSSRLAVRFHEPPQYGIHAGLVASALGLEPLDNVGIKLGIDRHLEGRQADEAFGPVLVVAGLSASLFAMRSICASVRRRIRAQSVRPEPVLRVFLARGMVDFPLFATRWSCRNQVHFSEQWVERIVDDPSSGSYGDSLHNSESSALPAP